MDTKEILKKHNLKKKIERESEGLLNIQQIMKEIEKLIQIKMDEIRATVSKIVLDNTKADIEKAVNDLLEGAKTSLDEAKKLFEKNITSYINSRKIELKGDPGKNYELTGKDKAEIASKIPPKIVEKVIEKREIIKIKPEIVKEIVRVEKQTIENPKQTGKEVISEINKAEEKILISSVKDLAEKLEDIKKMVREGGRVQRGGGGMGNTQHESKAVTSATTSVKTAYAVAANGFAVWIYYQGQMVARGVGYTMANDRRTINLLFTPDDSTYVDIIYIR